MSYSRPAIVSKFYKDEVVWSHSSVTEHLSSGHQALGLIYSTEKEQKTKRKRGKETSLHPSQVSPKSQTLQEIGIPLKEGETSVAQEIVYRKAVGGR